MTASPEVTASPETIRFLLARRSAKIVTIVEPGPSPEELTTILTIAARVPDHGKLAPWRFILFEGETRAAFGEVLARRFAEVEPRATPDMIAFERARFLRAPLVVGVVSSVQPDHPKVPVWEQQLSAGAAGANMVAASEALGYAPAWLTEWYGYDEGIAAALGLGTNERMAGFVYIGSRSAPKDDRPRPALADVVTTWSPR
ncbi:MAG: nitroreductase [Parvibaculaceae bacterium]|nr:nitroreductase [Parvibaculaceae bacterium]